MLIAGSVAIIVITVVIWIYLLTKNEKEEWEEYSDGDPKDHDPDYEKIMKEVREHSEQAKAKGIKANFDDDIPF